MWSQDVIGPSPYELDELYSLYRETAGRSMRGIEQATPPGEMRQYFLNLHRPLPKEHFEARMVELYRDQAQYAHVTELLRAAAGGEIEPS
jgi:hypothetical protein